MENFNNNNRRKMKWQLDLDSYFNIYSTFILEGYIDDVQPNVIDNEENVNYVSVTDYLENHYFDLPETHKKCVIIYDPTESSDKRFKICGPCEETLETNSETNETTINKVYDNQLAQHFWEILNESGLEEKMINHNAGGVSLDLARIHYVLTENERISELEILEKFRNFWDNFIVSNPVVDGYIFVIKMASRLLTREGSSNGLGADELLIFRQLLALSQCIDENKIHKLVVLANKTTDLPSWFTDETMNPFVKTLTITKPTKENKDAFFDMLVNNNYFGETFNENYRQSCLDNQDYEENIKRQFNAFTNDFTMKGLLQYSNYLQQGNTVDKPDKLNFSIIKFKAGDVVNPWDDPIVLRRILTIAEKVSETIMGQDFALNDIQNVLNRAAQGMHRIDNPNIPRVVLFLAGPTGTGKTEVCKQLAKCIFGSEERIVRLDMSEYGQEHSDQKLFGAPPGYVGYEEGGILTNAVKKEPFSLVLFDEIEKAHPKILDKFLQLLGDGRLTDGRGDTVSFSDSIIVITSNAGILSPTPKTDQEAEEIEKAMGNEPRPTREINMKAIIEMEREELSPEVIYQTLREYLRYNVKYYFTCQIKRPELYGRIEDGIVYYNYISNDAVVPIVNSKIKKISKLAKEKHFFKDVICPEEVKSAIYEYCKTEQVRCLGARGIGKAVDKIYNGSLSNFLRTYILNDREYGGTGESDLTISNIRGKTLECYLDDDSNEVFDLNDLKWRVLEDEN